MLKVFVISPKVNVDEIIDAMSKAGAGVIGKYTHNAFVTEGIGNWKNEEGTNPEVGKVGEMMRYPESKIEMVCPEEKLDAVLKTIRKFHPYETSAIDVYKLQDYDFKYLIKK